MDSSTADKIPTKYNLLMFGDGPYRCRLYRDDGHSFAYKQGDFALDELTSNGSNFDLARLAGHAKEHRLELVIVHFPGRPY